MGFDKQRERASITESSPPITFFSLPFEVRISVYKLLLAVPHPLFLFHDGSRVQTFAPNKPRLWLALLYSSRQLHAEARAVVYASNSFALLDRTPQQLELLEAFLDGIGPTNAGFLSQLGINFPVVESMDESSGVVELREDNIRSLDLIREKCTNLKTLETMVYSLSSNGLPKPDGNELPFIRKALSGVDAQLRTIGSLRRIIVKVYGHATSPSEIKIMEKLGWEVTFASGM